MRKQFLLIGAAVFLAALNAQARIGYTLDQCIKQYGPVVADRAWGYTNEKIHFYTFVSDDIEIEVCLVEGKVTRITYEKKSYPYFSAQDVLSLLRKNANTFPWKKEAKAKESGEELDIEQWYSSKNRNEVPYGATTWAKAFGLYHIVIKDYAGEERFEELSRADMQKRAQKIEAAKQQSVDKL